MKNPKFFLHCTPSCKFEHKIIITFPNMIVLFIVMHTICKHVQYKVYLMNLAYKNYEFQNRQCYFLVYHNFLEGVLFGYLYKSWTKASTLPMEKQTIFAFLKIYSSLNELFKSWKLILVWVFVSQETTRRYE